MPLTRKVTFAGVLEKCGRVHVPKLIRWQFKMETEQVLKVGVKPQDSYKSEQNYFAKITQDGRIRVPKLALSTFEDKESSLSGCILEISLEPA